jgi:hypothetical protein
VTEEFNEMCTAAGVQCTITSQQTESGFFRRYEMVNLGKQFVTFLYKGKLNTLKPGQTLHMLADSDPMIVGHSVFYEKVL